MSAKPMGDSLVNGSGQNSSPGSVYAANHQGAMNRTTAVPIVPDVDFPSSRDMRCEGSSQCYHRPKQGTLC